MKKFKTLKTKAFSLMELAIVGLVISLLIAGIMQSRVLVKKAKLANARTATTNSPVMSMGDLMLWYETTLDKSFGDVNVKDGLKVETWYDLNPNINTVRNNASQTIQTHRPTYKVNKINELPAIEFKRSNENFMLFDDGSQIVNSEYTIFIVGQRTDSGTSYFIGGNETTSDSNLRIGYTNDLTISALHWGNGIEVACDSYTEPDPIIFSVTFNFNERKLYLDGELQTTTPIGSADESQALLSYADAGLGADVSNYLEGDIGEVVMFKKYLKKEERKSVERYLGEKWKIEVADD